MILHYERNENISAVCDTEKTVDPYLRSAQVATGPAGEGGWGEKGLCEIKKSSSLKRVLTYLAVGGNRSKRRYSIIFLVLASTYIMI